MKRARSRTREWSIRLASTYDLWFTAILNAQTALIDLIRPHKNWISIDGNCKQLHLLFLKINFAVSLNLRNIQFEERREKKTRKKDSNQHDSIIKKKCFHLLSTKKKHRSFATRSVFFKSLIIKWRMTMTTWFADALSFSLSFFRFASSQNARYTSFSWMKIMWAASFRLFNAQAIDHWHSG